MIEFCVILFMDFGDIVWVEDFGYWGVKVVFYVGDL